MSSSDDFLYSLIEEALNQRNVAHQRHFEPITMVRMCQSWHIPPGYYLSAILGKSILNMTFRWLDIKTYYEPAFSNPYINDNDHLLACSVIDLNKTSDWDNFELFFDQVAKCAAKNKS